MGRSFRGSLRWARADRSVAQMTDHLGYDKHDPAGGAVLTVAGDISFRRRDFDLL